mmetsp:Transcript_61939/g.108929  ORF Transcript_61939/g.108929 Transcript_61939/m.108929 type:complete len:342 (-) Transcript_61939:768-1793(-)
MHGTTLNYFTRSHNHIYILPRILPSIFLISDMSPCRDCSSDFICCTSASAAPVSRGTTTGLDGGGGVGGGGHFGSCLVGYNGTGLITILLSLALLLSLASTTISSLSGLVLVESAPSSGTGDRELFREWVRPSFRLLLLCVRPFRLCALLCRLTPSLPRRPFTAMVWAMLVVEATPDMLSIFIRLLLRETWKESFFEGRGSLLRSPPLVLAKDFLLASRFIFSLLKLLPFSLSALIGAQGMPVRASLRLRISFTASIIRNWKSFFISSVASATLFSDDTFSLRISSSISSLFCSFSLAGNMRKMSSGVNKTLPFLAAARAVALGSLGSTSAPSPGSNSLSP